MRDADLFGVELHLALGLGEKLNVVRAVDLLSDDSNLISDRKLEEKSTSSLRRVEDVKKHKCE